MPRKAMTLMELLVVLAVLTTLAAVVVPALAKAKDQARLAQCAFNMRQCHIALASYAAVNDRKLPPFAFSSYTSPDLQISGHWCGVSGSSDPVAFGRRFGWRSVEAVNLGTLVWAQFAPQSVLDCPSQAFCRAPGRFSSYCLRFPTSEDLVGSGPPLVHPGLPLLQAYLATPGMPLRRAHGEVYNVAYGMGAVRGVRDNGAVSVNARGGAGADDGQYMASYGERVWQFFDQAR